MLSNVNTAIDTFQNVKTKFVDAYVKNEEIKKPLHTFINAQTEYAKAVAAEVNTFWTKLGMSVYAFDAKKAFATK